MGMRALMWILWPSFLVAAVGFGLVFALVDPLDLVILNQWRVGRIPAYTLGFLLLWGLAAASSALTFGLAPRGQLPDDFDGPADDPPEAAG